MIKSKILLVIPCYNCEKQIPRVIDGFDKKLLDRIFKIIIVDNQSTDLSIKTAINAIKKVAGAKKIFVVRNTSNYNLGGTHKVGFEIAQEYQCSHLAILHGDNQACTEELNDLIDEVEKSPDIDAVLGSRFMRGSQIKGYSKARIIGNLIINCLFSLVAFRISSDLGSGLNIFKISAFEYKKILSFSDDLTFNIDLLLYCFGHKLKTKFVPISWSETDQISNAKAWKIASIACIKLFRWRLGITVKPIIKNYSYTQVYP